MFASGVGPDGRPRVKATICPVRLLDPDAEAVVAWFLGSTKVEPLTGRLEGPSEWPRPGGLLVQDASLVEAVNVLRAEVDYLPSTTKPAKGPEPKKRKR